MRSGVRIAVGLLVVAAVAAGPGWAMFVRAPEVPVERLLKNVAAYVKENPSDPQGYYLLGRINALAFALKTGKLRAFERKGKPLPTLDPSQGGRGGRGGGRLPARGRVPAPGRPLAGDTDQDVADPDAAQLKKHLTDAVTNFRKAIAMKPDSGLYHLGLAYVLNMGARRAVEYGAPPGESASGKPGAEQVARWEKRIAQLGAQQAQAREKAARDLSADLPAAAATLQKHAADKDPERKARIEAVLSEYWKAKAAENYLRAHELAYDKDQKIKFIPLRGLNSLVSYESGKSYIGLVGPNPSDEKQKKAVTTITAHLKELEGKPRGPITPIIFSLGPDRQLAELLAPQTTVRFDLDGDGTAQRWPWVKPTTGILVWDPAGRGQITSGRQLFGSVTFWMFFNDGFHALQALDDDRDGRLAGRELRGLAVWFDRNANARSEPGEVVPVERLGILAIEAKATATEGDCPAHPAGLKLADGTTRPVYDWLTEPAGE